jgi:hypothetical protein
VGGTATVTITLENIDPTQTVYDVNLDDSQSWVLYQGSAFSRIIVTGSQTANWTSIAQGVTVNHTYQITIYGEGSFVAQRANVSYDDDTARTWHKSSNEAYVIASYSTLIEFILTIMGDIPWSIPVILIIVLIAIYSLIWLLKTILGIFRRGPSRPAAPSTPPPPPKEFPEEPPPDEYEPPAKDYVEGTCINCGSPVPDGVTFCPACGAKVTDL